LSGSVQGGIAAAGAVIVAASTGGEVAAFRASGRGVSPLWRARPGPVYRRPAAGAAAGTLFVPSADQHLYALDAATGPIRWRAGGGVGVLAGPRAVAGGGGRRLGQLGGVGSRRRRRGAGGAVRRGRAPGAGPRWAGARERGARAGGAGWRQEAHRPADVGLRQ